jgi:hypothetical protein
MVPSAEEILYPDMQKPRRASLITALVALSSLPGYMSPLPFGSATFTNAYRRVVMRNLCQIRKLRLNHKNKMICGLNIFFCLTLVRLKEECNDTILNKPKK